MPRPKELAQQALQDERQVPFLKAVKDDQVVEMAQQIGSPELFGRVGA